MNQKSRRLLLILIAAFTTIGFYLLRATSRHESALLAHQTANEGSVNDSELSDESLPVGGVRRPTPVSQNAGANAPETNTSAPSALSIATAADSEEAPSPTRDYVVEDGVAIVDGDIVLGDAPNGQNAGTATLSALNLWPTHEIPYFIQPSLSDPNRIEAAIRLFASTDVQFVPYVNQPDVLVFQEGTGSCKSYMGRLGGKQPIFLAPACGPYEIAHELMHALGFVHEQNRLDRDQFLKINKENIDDKYAVNFERMPESYMKLSASPRFGYDSVMIYPPSMFSKNGLPTMEPMITGRQIAPGPTLSPDDMSRINAYFRLR